MPTNEEIEKSIREAIGKRPHLFRTDPFLKTLDGLSPGTRANLDSQGRGPTERYLVGRETAYLPDGYVKWLVARISQRSKRIAA
jgi:hypothetical protein